MRNVNLSVVANNHIQEHGTSEESRREFMLYC
jgi:hypothetical protein